VSKATLYRQWTGKATLVAHALKRIGQPIAQTADTGSLRGDFAAIMRASTTAAPARTPELPPDPCEAMAGVGLDPGYSAWIQLTKSSRLTVFSRAGWSVARCPRIIPTT